MSPRRDQHLLGISLGRALPFRLVLPRMLVQLPPIISHRGRQMEPRSSGLAGVALTSKWIPYWASLLYLPSICQRMTYVVE